MIINLFSVSGHRHRTHEDISVRTLPPATLELLSERSSELAKIMFGIIRV